MLVRRERILARPPAFYQRALALVLADPDDAENTGHALERLWQAVFAGTAQHNAARLPHSVQTSARPLPGRSPCGGAACPRRQDATVRVHGN